MTTRNDIERVLWKACDSFRGKIDSSRYKDYILSMLFVKYLSDVTLERRALYMEQYDGDERRVERAMSRERFSLDRESTFDYLYENRTDTEIGQKINVALPTSRITTVESCATCSAPSTSTHRLTSATSGKRTRRSAICWKTSTTWIFVPASSAPRTSSETPMST